MNNYNYYRWNFGRYLLIITILFLLLCILIMVNSLYKTAGGVGLSIGVEELRPKIQPISHEKYDELIRPGGGFKGTYIPTNVHKRNIFSQLRETGKEFPGGEITGPEDERIFKDPKVRLRITKIYKKPVELLFKGYIQLGDGTYVATINWAGKTDFKKIGEEIRGYKVVDFKKNVSERKTLWGGSEKIDQSIVTLERDTGEKFSLEIGKITLEKEIYGEIFDRKEAKKYEVYIGSEILGNKILDISPSQIIISTPNGEKVFLVKES